MQKQEYSIENGATRLALTLQKKYPVEFGKLKAEKSYGLSSSASQIDNFGGIKFFKKANLVQGKHGPNLEFFKKHGVDYMEFQEIRETAFNHLQYISLCKFLVSNLCAKAQKEFPISEGDYSDMLRTVNHSFKAYDTEYSMECINAESRVNQILKIMKAMEIIPPSQASGKFSDFAYFVKKAARDMHMDYALMEFHAEDCKSIELQDKNRLQAFHMLTHVGSFVETLFREIFKAI